MTEWAESYFELGYVARWELGPQSRKNEHEVDGLWALLALKPGARVLDVACGHGVYAVTLHGRGAQVTGLDRSRALLRRAQHLAEECSTRVDWIRGDMRQLPFGQQEFRAALLFDAFGFFDQEADHDLVLSELFRVLSPGGRTALKVVNAEPILADFRATDRVERNGTIVDISRTLIANPIRLVEKVLITGAHETDSYERRQRLYTATELYDALERAGFVVRGLFSGFSGAPFAATSSASMVIVGEHPVKST